MCLHRIDLNTYILAHIFLAIGFVAIGGLDEAQLVLQTCTPHESTKNV